ncbi:MAG TPA: hypothetical protein VH063_06590 [Gaiellaceae bacterium]|jgi:hypothetical protein|nr:hypothetical protein [Gaiellaceae bacterium]
MFAGRFLLARPVALIAPLLLLALPAAEARAANAAPLSLTTAIANAHWSEGWLKPGANIRFSGTAQAPTTLTAALRPVGRAGVVTARASFELAHAGAFTEQIHLPPRPLPGVYSLRVGGTSAGATLPPVEIKVTIPAPPEGVLDRVEVSTSPSGPWLVYGNGSAPVISGAHRELWMRFRFLYPPTGKQVQLVWKMRWHVVVGKISKLVKDTLNTSVASKTALPSGHWVAVLKFDGRIAKKMDVILRS